VLSVVALGAPDDDGLLYAATGNGIYRSSDGGRTWQAYSEGAEGKSFVSLALHQDGQATTLYALSLGGLLFRRAIP